LSSFTPSSDFINTDITKSPRKDDFDLFGATVRYDAGVGAVSLAASQYKHDIDFTCDSTRILLFFGVPIAGITQQPQEYKTKMAELRFASNFDSPFNFVAGGYYQKDENEFNVHVVTTDGSGGTMRCSLAATRSSGARARMRSSRRQHSARRLSSLPNAGRCSPDCAGPTRS